MPYVIRKIRNKQLYSVKNAKDGTLHAKGTTLTKAKKQVRLLSYLDKNKQK